MRGLHWKRCLVYIDDILVFGNDFESALHNLELVLDRVAEYGLQLKSTKCHIVERAGQECDPNKLSAVANWIPHTTTKGGARVPRVHGILQTICFGLLHGCTGLGTLVGKRL